VIEQGEDALVKVGVSEDWAKAIKSCAEQYIQIRKVQVERIVELKCFKPNGIEAIRKSLIKAMNESNSNDIKVNINLVGTPRYRVTVTAKDYKIAEKEIDKTVSIALEEIKANGGDGSLVKS
jgi:translation initiation factor 2 subunit 1